MYTEGTNNSLQKKIEIFYLHRDPNACSTFRFEFCFFFFNVESFDKFINVTLFHIHTLMHQAMTVRC